jgi:hypothetical protein
MEEFNHPLHRHFGAARKAADRAFVFEPDGGPLAFRKPTVLDVYFLLPFPKFNYSMPARRLEKFVTAADKWSK